MNRFETTPLLALMLALAFGSLTAAANCNAQTLESTTDLHTACQQAPNNTITLQNNTKIFRGRAAVIPEQANCGCTIVIPPGVKLEFEDVGITFAGGISFISTGTAEVKLKNSSIHADSVNISLPGQGSAFSVDYANIGATAGDMTITFGNEGLLQTKRRLIPGEGYSLLASGVVRILAGAKFNVEMEQNHVVATGGFELRMNGADGVMKCDTVRILAAAGAVSITSASDKATVELASCWLVARDQINLGLSGPQSKVSMKSTNLVRDDAGAPSLSVRVEVSGAEGSVDVSQVGLHNINSIVTLRAGQRGSLKIENSGAVAMGAVQFLSGLQGTTEVKSCNLISDVRIRIAAGAGGNCSSLENLVSSPIVEACQ